MAKYLDYVGLGKVWEKIKARDNQIQQNLDNLKADIKSGTVIAGKATADGNGNTISTTYLTISSAKNTYMPIRAASSAALGGIKTNGDSITTPIVADQGTTSQGGYYPIELDKGGVAWVKVPWKDFNTTYTLSGSDAIVTLTPSTNGVQGTPSSITINNVGHASAADTATKATNDSDGNKISTTYLKASLKGKANGLAELGSDGKVPSAQLPSYVDDVIEGYLYNGKFYKESAHTTAITGEGGKIYVDLSTEVTYRWSGSKFVEISKSLAVGTTSGTAYDGAKGAALEKKVNSLESTTSGIKNDYLPKVANSVRVDRVAGSGSTYYFEVQTGYGSAGAIAVNNTRMRVQEGGFEIQSSLTDTSSTTPRAYKTTFLVAPTGVTINGEEVASTAITEAEINTLCV